MPLCRRRWTRRDIPFSAGTADAKAGGESRLIGIVIDTLPARRGISLWLNATPDAFGTGSVKAIYFR